MTNGTITNKIIKACKTETDLVKLRGTVEGLLNSFPLSSHKLVYDQDQAKVPAAAWAVLLEVCVATDKRKSDSNQRWMADMGVKQTGPTSFGRYTA